MVTKLEREKARVRKARAHDLYVQRTYGLAPGQYAEILAAQGGVCAICGGKPRRRMLAVDHDHFDGRVRGLLCYLCNKYLGQYERSEPTARHASLYLARIAEDFNRRHNEGLHRGSDDGPAQP